MLFIRGLREELGRPVSINEALSRLCTKGKLSDIAGSWKMDDDEEKELSEDLKKGWKRWKVRSV